MGSLDHSIVGSGSSGIWDNFLSFVSRNLVLTIAIPRRPSRKREAEIAVISPTNSLPENKCAESKVVSVAGIDRQISCF